MARGGAGVIEAILGRTLVSVVADDDNDILAGVLLRDGVQHPWRSREAQDDRRVTAWLAHAGVTAEAPCALLTRLGLRALCRC